MIICPNLSNPEVAREFNELVQATSEQAAYHIWSLNNGNAIDRAPNGAPSKLFQTLLEYYKGDRTKAIQAKAKTYGKSFLNWFGDWINDPANASKVVDENGEPLVVYHGNRTDNKIKSFDLSKKGSEHIEREISGFWFVDSERIATNEYALKAESWGTGNPKFGETLGVFLNIKNPVIAEQDIKEEMSPYGPMQFSKEKDFIHKAKLRQTSSTDGFILTMLDSDGDNVFEQSKQTQFVTFNPNQIKSATDNEGPTSYEGAFSRENDNIYDQLKSLGEELMKKCKGQ